MDMYVLFHELLVGHTRHFRMGLDVLVGDLRRFLHHVTEVSGHAERALSLAYRALDEEDLTSHLGPCEAGNDSRSLIALLHVMRVGRKAEILPQMILLYGLRIFLLEGYLLCCHARHLGDLLLETAHARLACIFVNDLCERALVELELTFFETMLLDLLRHEIVLRDLDLLLCEVSADIDHLHTVLEGRLNAVYIVRRGDKQDVRKIVIDIEVVIMEGRILLRIKGFKESRRRIALEVAADLVNLVEHNHRIGCTRTVDAVEDTSRKCTDICLPMTADF